MMTIVMRDGAGRSTPAAAGRGRARTVPGMRGDRVRRAARAQHGARRAERSGPCPLVLRARRHLPRASPRTPPRSPTAPRSGRWPSGCCRSLAEDEDGRPSSPLIGGVDHDARRRARGASGLPEPPRDGSTVARLCRQLELGDVSGLSGNAGRPTPLRPLVRRADEQNDPSFRRPTRASCAPSICTTSRSWTRHAPLGDRAPTRDEAGKLARLLAASTSPSRRRVADGGGRRGAGRSAHRSSSSRRHCPACNARDGVERSQLELVIAALALSSVRDRYERSHGLCVRHSMQVAERADHSARAAPPRRRRLAYWHGRWARPLASTPGPTGTSHTITSRARGSVRLRRSTAGCSKAAPRPPTPPPPTASPSPSDRDFGTLGSAEVAAAGEPRARRGRAGRRREAGGARAGALRAPGGRPRSDRGLPGPRQDADRTVVRDRDRHPLLARAVHAGPDALGRHRRIDLQPAHERSSSSAPDPCSPTYCWPTRSTAPRRRLRRRCSRRCRSARSRPTIAHERSSGPFLVLATQNPIEYEGTYPLPEAQLDRFLIRMRVGYPSADDEWDILERRIDRREDEAELRPGRRPRRADRDAARGRGRPRVREPSAATSCRWSPPRARARASTSAPARAARSRS